MPGKSTQPKKEAPQAVPEEVVPEEEGSDAKKKHDALRKKLTRCEKEKQEYLEGWQRAKADLVNFRKQLEELTRRAEERGAERILDALAPALDSFHAAMQGGNWETLPEDWRKGIEAIYAQITAALESAGAQVFDPTGETFDPAQHESIGTEPVTEPQQDHIVVRTVQKGIRLGSHVVRPAKVLVGMYQERRDS